MKSFLLLQAKDILIKILPDQKCPQKYEKQNDKQNIDTEIFRQDFYRQFGPRCAGCQLVFSETEKVRKIDQSFFHGHCFKCSVCSKDLTEAEKVGCDQNGNLLCETDFLKNHCDDLDNGGHSERLLDECESDKKDESHLPNRDLTEGLSEEEQEINKEVIDDPKKNGRKRGPKTTIKPHQLELLKNVFDQNPKPTPKMSHFFVFMFCKRTDSPIL